MIPCVCCPARNKSRRNTFAFGARGSSCIEECWTMSLITNICFWSRLPFVIPNLRGDQCMVLSALARELCFGRANACRAEWQRAASRLYHEQAQWIIVQVIIVSSGSPPWSMILTIAMQVACQSTFSEVDEGAHQLAQSCIDERSCPSIDLDDKLAYNLGKKQVKK